MNRRLILISILVLMLLISATMPMIMEVQALERKKLIFDLIVPTELPMWVRVAQIYKEDLAKIGIKVNVKAMETGAWINAMMKTHDFDIAMCGMLMEPTPSYLPELFHSKYAKSGFNIAGVNDSKLDKLLEDSMVTTDPVKLKQIIYEIQRIIAENVYSIPIFTEYVIFAYNKKFTGFVPMPGGIMNIWTYLNVRLASGEEGGVLRLAMIGDIKTQNPLLRTLALEAYIDRMIYDTLVEFAPNLSVVPYLAERWEVSKDGKVWTFYLVKNATWHDGKPVTADDVVFTISLVLKYKPATWYSYFELIDHAEAVDKYTVKIYMKKPYAWLLTTFASFPILPKHIWEKTPWNASNCSMIGSGPFKWVRWKRGEFIELVRNPNYWRKGHPHLDKILLKVYADSSAAVLALRAGEVDVMYRYIPRTAIATLKQDPNIEVGQAPGLNFRYFIPNLRRKPFDDINVRKALAYAVDKETIVKKLYLGYAIPIDSFVPQSWGVWHNPNLPQYPFNLTKAAEILDKAGYIDVDNDGIREMPGAVTPTPSPSPTATPTTTPSPTPSPSPSPSPTPTPTPTPQAGMSPFTIAGIIIVIVVIIAIVVFLFKRGK